MTSSPFPMSTTASISSSTDDPDGPVGDDAEAVVPPEAHPWSWHLSRVTGLLLAVGLPLHFLRTFVLTDITRVSARSVAVRWDDPVARVLDWAVLVVALVHGATSLAPRLAAGGADRPARRALAVGVWTATAVLVAALTAVLLTYRFS